MVIAVVLVAMTRLGLAESTENPVESVASGRGTVRFAERALLTFGITGKIERINVDEGDTVREGEILSWLYDDSAEAALEEAKAAALNTAAIEVARQELVAALQQSDAVRRANERHPNAFSRIRALELETVVARANEVLKQQKENIRMAQLACETAQAQLEALRMNAPFSGTIVRRFKNGGEGVGPADAVLELVNDEIVRVDVFLPPEVAARLHVGDLARLTVTTDDDLVRPILRNKPEAGNLQNNAEISDKTDHNSMQPLVYGKIGFIDLTVQPVRRVVRVWVEASRPEALRDGMQVHVEFLGRVKSASDRD